MQSIPLLLMSWRHKSPGHQQPWYWPIYPRMYRPGHLSLCQFQYQNATLAVQICPLFSGVLFKGWLTDPRCLRWVLKIILLSPGISRWPPESSRPLLCHRPLLLHRPAEGPQVSQLHRALQRPCATGRQHRKWLNRLPWHEDQPQGATTTKDDL